MRVELPEGYVPPEPTHPHYGYLTPEEQEASEAAPPTSGGGKNGPEFEPFSPPPVVEEAEEAEEATVARPGWVPEPPPEAPATEPATLGAAGEYRWDAYRQEWVLPEEPAPDVAAAAGGRGASSSWTSADGSRFRWDARAQRWVTEPPEPPE